MNWKLLIADLKARGWTETQIATYCECSQGTVNALAHGTNTNPRYSIGERLRTLYERICTTQQPIQAA